MLKTLKKIKTPKEVNCSSILVVYKSKEGTWRGFAHPFNVTIEADTKTKATLVLNEKVEAYCEGLKKYDYPDHLANRHLSNEEDNAKFNEIALESLIDQGHIDKADLYAETKTISS